MYFIKKYIKTVGGLEISHLSFIPSIPLSFLLSSVPSFHPSFLSFFYPSSLYSSIHHPSFFPTLLLSLFPLFPSLLLAFSFSFLLLPHTPALFFILLPFSSFFYVLLLNLRNSLAKTPLLTVCSFAFCFHPSLLVLSCTYLEVICITHIYIVPILVDSYPIPWLSVS